MVIKIKYYFLILQDVNYAVEGHGEMSSENSIDINVQPGTNFFNEYFISDHIYEVICKDSVRNLNNKCEICSDGASNDSISKNTGKKNGFSKLLKGMVNKKVTKNSKIKRSNSKIEKDDIKLVHGELGRNTVFKTQCTFDINEMCRLQKAAFEIDSEHDKKSNFINQLNINKKSTNHNLSVQFWLSTIKTSVEQYEYSEQYNVKSIPSKTFNETLWNSDCSSKNYCLNENDRKIKKKSDVLLEERNKNFVKTNSAIINETYFCGNTCRTKQNLQQMENKSYKEIKSNSELDRNKIIGVLEIKNTKQTKQTYNYLNKIVLSVSLNTITLSYYEYLKKIELYGILMVFQEGSDNSCDLNKIKKKIISNTISDEYTYILKKLLQLLYNKDQKHYFFSKSDSLKILPSTHNNDISQPLLMFNKELSSNQVLKNMNPNSETVKNDDIYYTLWNCETNSESRDLEISIPSNYNNYWEAACNDSTDEQELINDSISSIDSREDVQEKMSRSYSNVYVFYHENSKYNQIIYDNCLEYKSFPNSSADNYKNRDYKSYIRPSDQYLKGYSIFGHSTVPESVTEFFKTILNNEDEDELIITVPKIQDCNTLAEINNNRANSENSISHNYIEDELTKPNEVPYRKPKMKRQKPIQQQSVSKNRLKENTNKYVQNQRVVRRKSVEEISHTFQQPMTKLSRHTKSTSNLLELKDDESKSSSSFMTRIRKLFKKREIPLGPGPLENKVFGNSLAILEISSEVPNVPLIVVACIKRLEEEDMIITHGLYRASGNKITIDELKKKVEQNNVIYDFLKIYFFID
uniref:CSON011299 protein n=1 Tax=Culicoides sonorensis TaxID=179676 RepID=A0A336K433_CULSO